MGEESPVSSLLGVLKTFVQLLPTPAPEYCLIGGLALGTWGQVRATQDIDFLMFFNEETQDTLFSTLAPHGFELDTQWTQANPMLKGITARLRYLGYAVDLLNPRDSHEKETLNRKQLITVHDFSVWISSPEDLILLKLKASRTQDFVDSISVVARQGESLNLDYLWHWADHLGLQSELHYILHSSDPPS